MRIIKDYTKNHPALIDPSELFRPENKDKKLFRTFSTDETDPLQKRVMETYYNMHTHQTVDFVHEKMDKWLNFDHFEATIMEALQKLNDLVDESDPDVDVPNIVHAFQTAERIREKFPDNEWFQLTGLVHDLGKVMAFYDEPQWAVVGDTFPVGCFPQESIVYRDWSFKDNEDLKNPRYNTKYGLYKPGIGLDRVIMSWGHDEFMYRVLVNCGAKLPEESLYIIRFHSFYPWHTGEDYMELCSDKDKKMLQWIRMFNQFDLYTKSDKLPDVDALKPYYQSLIDKYIPGIIKF